MLGGKMGAGSIVGELGVPCKYADVFCKFMSLTVPGASKLCLAVPLAFPLNNYW